MSTQLRRSQRLDTLRQLEPRHVVMEACYSAHLVHKYNLSTQSLYYFQLEYLLESTSARGASIAADGGLMPR